MAAEGRTIRGLYYFDAIALLEPAFWDTIEAKNDTGICSRGGKTLAYGNS
jgi:hypothetical protein